MGSSSSGQQPITQTQTSDPWSGAQPHLQHTMGAAEQYFNNNYGYQPYTGQTLAELHPTFNLGLNNEAVMALNDVGGSPGVNAARTLGTNMIQNEGLSGRLQSLYSQAQGDQNPYLQSILDTSNRRIGDRINAGMSGAGRYGSGAHTDVMARALAESADPILAQDYARRQQQMQDIASGGLQRAGQWSQLMPTLDEARYAGAKRLEDIGQFFTNRDQQQIANNMALYNAQQAYPWEQLQRYQGIISGTGALGGTKTTSTTPYQPTTLQRVGGGALAGAGLGSLFGAPGAAIGAGAGGLLGLL